MDNQIIRLKRNIDELDLINYSNRVSLRDPRKQSTMSSIELKFFDIKEIPSDSTISIIAPRRSGKSVLVKDILFNLKDQFEYGMVMSSTEELNRFYQDFVPSIFIHHEYDAAKVSAVIEQQKKLVISNGKQNNNKMFCVFDDVLADSGWLNDGAIKDIFYNGRHFNMFFILSIQYAMALKPGFRSNLDYPIHDTKAWLS